MRRESGAWMTLGVVMVLAGCTGKTPDYCDAQTPCKTPGTYCDLERRQCLALDASLPTELGVRDGGDAGSGGELGLGDGPPISCGDDSACPATAYCEPTVKRCLPQKQNGLACDRPRQCGSGLCSTAEKVCCDRACDGACETCKGKPKCELRPKGDSCGAAPVCNNTPTGSSISEELCDGSSAQCQKQNTSCGAYRCDASGACLTSCTKHSECASKVCELWDAASKNTCVDATKVCYVDANGAPSGDGSLAKPYQKISDCTVKGAAIIAVDGGTYKEDIAISKDTLLLGYDAGPTLHGAAGGLTATVVIKPPAAGVVVATGVEARIVGVRIDGDVSSSSLPALLTVGPDSLGVGSDVALEMVHLSHAPIRSMSLSKCASVDGVDLTIANNSGPADIKQGCAASFEKLRLESNSAAMLIASSVKIVDLVANDNYSVALRVSSGGQLELERAVFSNNGIGVNTRDVATASLENVVAYSNTTVLKTEAYSQVSVAFATFFSSTGTQISCSTSKASTFVNSIVWGNPTHSGLCDFRYSALSTSAVGQGNISPGDPGFVGPNASPPNLRLKTGSPCVDVGVDSFLGIGFPTTDLDGKPRQVQVKAGASSKSDMGAYERQTP